MSYFYPPLAPQGSSGPPVIVQPRPGSDGVYFEGRRPYTIDRSYSYPSPDDSTHCRRRRHRRMRGKPGAWSTGLFDCTEDCSVCLCELCNPCYECMIMPDFGEDAVTRFCAGGTLTFVVLRDRFRRQLDIQSSLCMDCVTAVFCYPCMVCQMKREVDILKREGRKLEGPPFEDYYY